MNNTPNFSRYEPELFPGLIFRMMEPKVVLLIFASGKIVLTGAKNRKDIYNAYKRIKDLLLDHRKESTQVMGPTPGAPTSASAVTSNATN